MRVRIDGVQLDGDKIHMRITASGPDGSIPVRASKYVTTIDLTAAAALDVSRLVSVETLLLMAVAKWLSVDPGRTDPAGSLTGRVLRIDLTSLRDS